MTEMESFGPLVLLLGACTVVWALARKGKNARTRDAPEMPTIPKVGPRAGPPPLPPYEPSMIIKSYKGSQTEAADLFQRDATKMAGRRYFPTAQTWSPGQWGTKDFVVAFLLCIILIGLVVFVYLLIVRPPGTLTVTYERREDRSEEKTCPRCAERVKAAALVCRFCSHEFQEQC